MAGNFSALAVWFIRVTLVQYMWLNAEFQIGKQISEWSMKYVFYLCCVFYLDFVVGFSAR